MNHHTATAPDGTIVTRNSKTRTFSYAILARRGDDGWVALSWASRPDLAAKRAQEAEGWGIYDEVALAPATVK